jgi:peptidyl-prolyl cis-trans isomerase D
MISTMRRIATPVFAVLAVSFVGWFAYGQVTDVIAGGKDVVLKVDGDVVHSQPFQAQYQAALEQYRRSAGGGRLTREDEQVIQDRVADQFIQNFLLARAYKRLGITVSDDEIIQAAKSSPPPQILEQVLKDPTFQTNGQFDITKWQRYIGTASPEFSAQVEALYREYLPQRKLQEYLTADIYVSDAKLWRIWRDQRESVTVAVLAIRPEDIPDSLAPVSDAELASYYAAHAADFKRPAVASLSYVAIPRIPEASDTAAALAHARSLRADILSGKLKFADAAKQESADTVTGARGGDLGWVKRSERGFDPKFLAGLKGLRAGQLSQPVLSSFGFHLIKLEAASGDSLHLRHILVPIKLAAKHLDAVDARTDTLDRLAAEQTDGSRLDAAARALHLPLGQAPRLVEGERLRIGMTVVPDVSVWAFERSVGETSPVIEGEHASYVFRLDSLAPAGVPPLAAIRDRVLEAARLEKRKAVAREHAAQLAVTLREANDLGVAGRARGLAVERLGPFSRVTPPALLAPNPLVLGAAFGLKPGERSGLVAGETGFFLLQSLAHTNADSAAWVKQKDRQREALMRPIEQARIEQYLAALRANATIVDRRKELYRPTASSGS